LDCASPEGLYGVISWVRLHFFRFWVECFFYTSSISLKFRNIVSGARLLRNPRQIGDPDQAHFGDPPGPPGPPGMLLRPGRSRSSAFAADGADRPVNSTSASIQDDRTRLIPVADNSLPCGRLAIARTSSGGVISSAHQGFLADWRRISARCTARARMTPGFECHRQSAPNFFRSGQHCAKTLDFYRSAAEDPAPAYR